MQRGPDGRRPQSSTGASRIPSRVKGSLGSTSNNTDGSTASDFLCSDAISEIRSLDEMLWSESVSDLKTISPTALAHAIATAARPGLAAAYHTIVVAYSTQDPWVLILGVAYRPDQLIQKPIYFSILQNPPTFVDLQDAIVKVRGQGLPSGSVVMMATIDFKNASIIPCNIGIMTLSTCGKETFQKSMDMTQFVSPNFSYLGKRLLECIPQTGKEGKGTMSRFCNVVQAALDACAVLDVPDAESPPSYFEQANLIRKALQRVFAILDFSPQPSDFQEEKIREEMNRITTSLKWKSYAGINPLIHIMFCLSSPDGLDSNGRSRLEQAGYLICGKDLTGDEDHSRILARPLGAILPQNIPVFQNWKDILQTPMELDRTLPLLQFCKTIPADARIFSAFKRILQDIEKFKDTFNRLETLGYCRTASFENL